MDKNKDIIFNKKGEFFFVNATYDNIKEELNYNRLMIYEIFAISQIPYANLLFYGSILATIGPFFSDNLILMTLGIIAASTFLYTVIAPWPVYLALNYSVGRLFKSVLMEVQIAPLKEAANWATKCSTLSEEDWDREVAIHDLASNDIKCIQETGQVSFCLLADRTFC